MAPGMTTLSFRQLSVGHREDLLPNGYLQQRRDRFEIVPDAKHSAASEVRARATPDSHRSVPAPRPIGWVRPAVAGQIRHRTGLLCRGRFFNGEANSGGG